MGSAAQTGAAKSINPRVSHVKTANRLFHIIVPSFHPMFLEKSSVQCPSLDTYSAFILHQPQKAPYHRVNRMPRHKN
jgi:hypothetical protein